MLTFRPAGERGHTQEDWLESWHTFSFDRYYDGRHMGFGPIRVINEDTIAAGEGFGTHPHRDMEIITYVTAGQLQHKDSLGTGSIISAGEIQKMSAGTGIMHSEYNASKVNAVHLLQIWIVPNKMGIPPAYEQERFQLVSGEWKLLGAPDGAGLVSIHQGVKLYALSAKPGASVSFAPAPNAALWIQIIKGNCTIAGTQLHQGDGLSITEMSRIAILAADQIELLLFEISS